MHINIFFSPECLKTIKGYEYGYNTNFKFQVLLIQQWTIFLINTLGSSTSPVVVRQRVGKKKYTLIPGFNLVFFHDQSATIEWDSYEFFHFIMAKIATYLEDKNKK